MYPRYADYFALLASRSQREGSFFSVKLLCSQFEKEKEIVNMQSYYLWEYNFFLLLYFLVIISQFSIPSSEIFYDVKVNFIQDKS